MISFFASSLSWPFNPSHQVLLCPKCQVAVITGASTGIGLATVEGLVKSGAGKRDHQLPDTRSLMLHSFLPSVTDSVGKLFYTVGCNGRRRVWHHCHGRPRCAEASRGHGGNSIGMQWKDWRAGCWRSHNPQFFMGWSTVSRRLWNCSFTSWHRLEVQYLSSI